MHITYSTELVLYMYIGYWTINKYNNNNNLDCSKDLLTQFELFTYNYVCQHIKVTIRLSNWKQISLLKLYTILLCVVYGRFQMRRLILRQAVINLDKYVQFKFHNPQPYICMQ